MESEFKPVLDALSDALECDDGQARRVFHGRGGCYPGLEWLTLDDFGEGLWLVLFREPPPALEQVLVAGVTALAGERRQFALMQRRYRRPAEVEVLWGQVPDVVCAQEGELRFKLQLEGRQNTGYFMDASPGRVWLADRCAGKRVLNLFAYTCAFSVAARQAGATTVVNVDMAKAALRTGRDNHRINGHSMDGVEFLGYDIFRSWKRIRSLGPYDCLIVDPPSFQKGSFDARKDYVRLLRKVPELISDQAELLFCLNAPYLDENFLQEMIADALPDVEIVGFLPPRADFPEQVPALKMLHCRFTGQR